MIASLRRASLDEATLKVAEISFEMQDLRSPVPALYRSYIVDFEVFQDGSPVRAKTPELERLVGNGIERGHDKLLRCRYNDLIIATLSKFETRRKSAWMRGQSRALS